MERWWDGNAWTEYTRSAPVQGVPQQPYPGYPSGDIIGSPGGDGRNGRVAIAVVAALVLIGGVVAGIVVLGKGGDDTSAKAEDTPTPTATVPHEGRLPTPAPSAPGTSRSPGGPAVDRYDGISLPVPDGWEGGTSGNGIGASVVTGDYPCPLDTSQNCVRGGVFSMPAAALKLTATTPEAAARADIAKNASESYGTETYGATTSHDVVASTSVTVAGQPGYLVRWKISTKSGTGGYVESLVFPSPADKTKLVVVRFGFDIGGKAPGPDEMDRITRGIKADSSGGPSGTGV
jgi:hypothetical protein